MHAIEIDQRRFRSFAEDFLRRHFERLNADEKEGFRSEVAIGSSFPMAFEKYYSDLQALAPVRLEDVQSGVVKQRSGAARAAGGALFPYRVEVGAVLVGRDCKIPFAIPVWIDETGSKAMVAGRVPASLGGDSSR